MAERGRATPRVVVIGSGFGGLGIAITLQRAGVESFTVLEAGEALGGTWRDNTYPGCACDVPSQIYTYSFELKPDWERRFGWQPEIRAYLEHCARKYGVLDRIRFGARVTTAAFDEATGTWRVETAGGDQLTAEVLISGTGTLNRPQVPGFPGRESFAGPQFHSARWDHGAGLAGKRIAVIGTGASAIQFVPEVARAAARVAVFQRSPAWVLPKHDRPYTAVEKAVFRYVPGAQRLCHIGMFLLYDSRYAYTHPVLTPFRRLMESRAKATIDRHIADPALRDALTPDYPLGCKRVLISNDWYPTLARGNVELMTDAIERITPDGVVTASGRTVAADVIIYGTGFKATEYLVPMRVTGLGGRDLHKVWSDGAEAYLGMTVSGFPNLFILYGPNTNSNHNSVLHLLESQMHYIGQAIRHLTDHPEVRYLDVRADVQRDFNAWVQRVMAHTTFTANCSSWYRTASGKIVVNWPGSYLGYRLRTRRFDPAVYHRVGRDGHDLGPDGSGISLGLGGSGVRPAGHPVPAAVPAAARAAITVVTVTGTVVGSVVRVAVPVTAAAAGQATAVALRPVAVTGGLLRQLTRLL